MRLIDADNMRKPSKGMFIYQDEFEDDVQHIAFEAYTKEDIENERTVKAIPIEWIEKWLKAQERILRISPPYYHQITVRKMLEDWEKENDKDSERPTE